MRLYPAVLMILISSTVTAQPFVETGIIDAQDIDPSTEQGALGTLVRFAGDGRTLLATAPFRNDPSFSGSQNGSVYSFRAQENGTLQLLQILEPGARNQFGKILATDGEWAAIGEGGDKVRIYRLVNGTWNLTQLLRIDPDVPGTPGVTVRRLASSAAMSSSLLAIGDATTNIAIGEVTRSNAGSVILFRRANNNQWLHEATLIAPLPQSSFGFGDALAVSGDTVLVGAPDDSVPIGDASQIVGGAYLYRRNGPDWQHVRTLRDPDPVASNRRFGWSVAIEDDIAVAGCASCGPPDTGGINNTGAFFSYRRDLGGTNAWGLVGKTVASAPVSIDEFSISLSLRRKVMLVGASGNGARRASFFVGNSTGQWAEHSVLQDSAVTFTSFGASVDFSGGVVVIGAPSWPNTSFSERWGAISSWYSRSIDSCNGNFDGIYCDRFEALSQ